MDENARKTLSEIGSQLDQHLEIPVYNGGIVKPSDIPVTPLTLGKGDKYVRSRQSSEAKQGRPKTRPRQGAPSGQGPTIQPRTTNKPGAVFGSDLREKYNGEIADLETAYPGTQVWYQAEGLWLLSHSALLSGLDKQATFLTVMPYASQLRPKSWGFWTTPLSAEWIGPRHTNFPDGSVCAFEPIDGTWLCEDGIVKLLDQYTLWAIRHLHLEIFDRWPGRQSAPHPFERITEFRNNEYCGCQHSDRLYTDCCKERDLAQDQIAIEIDFWKNFAGSKIRTPPKAVVQFIADRKTLPRIEDLNMNIGIPNF